MKYTAAFYPQPDGKVRIVISRTDAREVTTVRSIFLSTTEWHRLTQDDINAIDEAIGSDGCSGPTVQLYRNGCVIHDFYYRLHRDFNGLPIDRGRSDHRLKRYIEMHSPFGEKSPMAEWRFQALQRYGQAAWDDSERGTPLCSRECSGIV